jgi:hypothetical protein
LFTVCHPAIMQLMSIDAASAYLWPTDLPDGCPPSDARVADGNFYRLVRNDPPAPSDFSRPRDQPRRTFSGNELCKASSLSIFGELGDAQTAVATVPGLEIDISLKVN